MSQSKKHSIMEALSGTAFGFIVSLCASPILYPLNGHSFSAAQTLRLTLEFTILSILRGYVWRRICNRFLK